MFTACLLLKAGQELARFWLAQLPVGLRVTQHNGQAHWSGGWDPNTTMRSSGSGLDLPYLALGSSQSAEIAALTPQALSGTTRGTGLSRWLLVSYVS